MVPRVFLSVFIVATISPAIFAQKPSVQESLKDLEVQGAWIYNDLDKGFAEAKKSNKPMLVVFR